MASLSVRIPDELMAQISLRARLHRRSKNSEIVYLLERAIQSSVNQDQDLLEKMRLRQDAHQGTVPDESSSWMPPAVR